MGTFISRPGGDRKIDDSLRLCSAKVNKVVVAATEWPVELPVQ